VTQEAREWKIYCSKDRITTTNPCTLAAATKVEAHEREGSGRETSPRQQEHELGQRIPDRPVIPWAERKKLATCLNQIEASAGSNGNEENSTAPEPNRKPGERELTSRPAQRTWRENRVEVTKQDPDTYRKTGAERKGENFRRGFHRSSTLGRDPLANITLEEQIRKRVTQTWPRPHSGRRTRTESGAKRVFTARDKNPRPRKSMMRTEEGGRGLDANSNSTPATKKEKLSSDLKTQNHTKQHE
jgi:hypothetical protein